MSVTKKTHTLGKINQLIDLNGDSTNFDASFTVTCKDDTNFSLSVVDQATLDSEKEIEYKDAKNTISGNIVVDHNSYQNYYLILKSDTPCIVDVEFTKKELPKNDKQPQQQQQKSQQQQRPQSQQQYPQPQQQQLHKQQLNQPQMRQPIQESTINWKKILLISVVVVAGIALLYYFYRKNATDKPVDSDNKGENNGDNKHEKRYNPEREQVLDSYRESNLSPSEKYNNVPEPSYKNFHPKMKYTSKNSSKSTPVTVHGPSSNRQNTNMRGPVSTNTPTYKTSYNHTNTGRRQSSAIPSDGNDLIDRLKRFSD
jgi:hypothetical protein